MMMPSPHRRAAALTALSLLLTTTSTTKITLAFAPVAPASSLRQRTFSRSIPSSSWYNSLNLQSNPNHHGKDGTDLQPNATTAEKKKPSSAAAAGVNLQKAGAHLTAAASLAALLSATALPADAAMSGGRMGGSFSRSSVGGGMTRMAPSRSFGGGGGGGYYSRGGPTIVTPYIAPPMPIITPFYSPIIPFGGGVGAISYSRGPGLLEWLFLGGIGLFALSTISSVLAPRNRYNQWSDDDDGGLFSRSASSSALGVGTSVVKLSVALDVPNRDDPYSLLSVLDRLAATADTGSRRGVQNLTSQVAVELLRRKSSIQSAAGSHRHAQDDGAAQRAFNQWAVQERSKFEKETVSKFGGVDTSAGRRASAGGSGSDNGGGKATMAVVTLVLSIQGDSTKVPKIRSIADVEEALRKIASDVKVDDCLLGAEILWTPQDRSEVLSRMEVVADYPELTTV